MTNNQQQRQEVMEKVLDLKTIKCDAYPDNTTLDHAVICLPSPWRESDLHMFGELLEALHQENQQLRKEIQIAGDGLKNIQEGVDHPEGKHGHDEWYFVAEWSSSVAQDALSQLTTYQPKI